jgi:hypothetical protein
MLRIPHCLDNRLSDGGKAVSPTHRPHFTPHKHYYFYVSSINFNFIWIWVSPKISRYHISFPTKETLLWNPKFHHRHYKSYFLSYPFPHLLPSIFDETYQSVAPVHFFSYSSYTLRSLHSTSCHFFLFLWGSILLRMYIQIYITQVY